MTSHQIFVLVLIQLCILLLPAFGLFKMFEKAKIPGWKAFIPFYNTWVMLDLAKRPRHWVYWQFIPDCGLVYFHGIYIEFVKTYGKFKIYEHALAALLPVFYFPYIGYNKTDRFIGAEGAAKYKKSVTREWLDAAVFAVIAATLIRTFIFEAYTISLRLPWKRPCWSMIFFLSASSVMVPVSRIRRLPCLLCTIPCRWWI